VGFAPRADAKEMTKMARHEEKNHAPQISGREGAEATGAPYRAQSQVARPSEVAEGNR
jgi:hypothetical protein